MGREVRILCDKCGKDVYGKEYYTLPLARVKNGKQRKFPTIWLCRDCLIKTNLLGVLMDEKGVDVDVESVGYADDKINAEANNG